MAQQIRQNYHEECEALVNKHINMELYASYVYTSMVRGECVIVSLWIFLPRPVTSTKLTSVCLALPGSSGRLVMLCATMVG